MGELTATRLRSLLTYDADTGVFRWSAKRRGVTVGAIAGRFTDDGHRQIRVEYVVYGAHRLAWLYMTGDWPPEEVDHINGIPDDNRFCNLRLASRRENGRNRRLNSNSSTGVKGVYYRPSRNKYVAQIFDGTRSVFLGYFSNVDEAVSAHTKASIEIFGEFRRL